MIEAYINNIEYFLPETIENNYDILKKKGRNNKNDKRIRWNENNS